ncbi:MAG: lytic murein transglycosylase B [Betaproteobacteria bacterium]
MKRHRRVRAITCTRVRADPRRWIAACCALLVACAWYCHPVPARAADGEVERASSFDRRADVQAFIAEMARSEGFDRVALAGVFAQVRSQPRVIAAMSRPIATPPKWYEYGPQFLNPSRIDAGVAFWRANDAALARAQSEFGVPAEVIVAIIGVETYYGRNTGSYRVIDALSTLAFDYPRRAEYFTGELRNFLLLCREQSVSPLAARGSFAGAVGLPQFMPGSIRNYAVDYDGDGRIDLANNPDDAVGSVANYLSRHGWQTGQPVMTQVRLEDARTDELVRLFDGGVAERRPVAAWVRDGVTGFVIPGDLGSDPVGLLMLESHDAPEYWMTFTNWFVLTRYNRSRLYASSVWLLAQALKTASESAIAR